MSTRIDYPCGCEYQIGGPEQRENGPKVFNAWLEKTCPRHKHHIRTSMKQRMDDSYRMVVEFINEME